MVRNTDIRIQGNELLQNKQVSELYGGLSLKDKNRVLRLVFKNATVELRKSAKNNRKLTRKHTSKTRNKLVRSIGVQTFRKIVGVRIGFRRGKMNGQLSHLIDAGTKGRFQKKTGRYTGHVDPTNFWTDARKEEIPHVYDNLQNRIEESFKTFAIQYNKKYRLK